MTFEERKRFVRAYKFVSRHQPFRRRFEYLVGLHQTLFKKVRMGFVCVLVLIVLRCCLCCYICTPTQHQPGKTAQCSASLAIRCQVNRQYTFPESIRQQTRRRGSIAKVLIYAKLHVKFKVSSLNFTCNFA